MKKALFLDRDGVINVNHGYVHKCENFDFIDGVFELVRYANSNGYLVIVVTNQAGIGRGFYTENQFNTLTKWMCNEFQKRGCCIEKVYYSPYHPIEGIGCYKKDEETRKPRPGMLLKAMMEFDLCMAESVMIGDKDTDIQAGLAAGVGMNILLSSKRSENLKGLEYKVVNYLSEVEVLLR